MDVGIVGCHCEWTLVLITMHAIKVYFRLTSTCELYSLGTVGNCTLFSFLFLILWEGMCSVLALYLYHHTGSSLLLLASLYICIYLLPPLDMPSWASPSSSGVEHCAPPEESRITLFPRGD